MARPGPKPKPTSLKLLHGNPGKRALNRDEPKPPPVTPTCPAWLDATAKSCWRRNIKLLEPLGLITRLDRDALERYCQAYSTYRQAADIVNKTGILVARQHGRKAADGSKEAVKNPAIQVMRDMMALMQHEAAEFGMTPSSRGRLSTTPPEDENDEFERLLRGRN